MHGKTVTQYTIRGVRPSVDQALRRIAAESGRSLNDVASEALARGAGVDSPPEPSRDLEQFFGSWVEDPAVDGALAAQRGIDEELWR